MISLTERLVIAVIGAGAGWIMGRAEGHGSGFQTYVRYAAAVMFVSITSFAWADKVLPEHPIVLALLGSGIVIFTGWYRHLK